MALTFTSPQGVTKRCHLSRLTSGNSALVYEPKCGGRGEGVAGSQPMSAAVHRSPNKLWRSNSILNLDYGFNLHLTTGGHKEMSSYLG